MVSLDPDTLTPDQKQKALCTINLIKEECCGNIKGRTCTNGRPEQKYTTKEDVMSPSISQESLMVSLI